MASVHRFGRVDFGGSNRYGRIGNGGGGNGGGGNGGGGIRSSAADEPAEVSIFGSNIP